MVETASQANLDSMACRDEMEMTVFLVQTDHLDILDEMGEMELMVTHYYQVCNRSKYKAFVGRPGLPGPQGPLGPQGPVGKQDQ